MKRVVHQGQSLGITRPPHVHLTTTDNLGNAKFISGACLSWNTGIPVGKSESGTCIEIFLLGGMVCKHFGNSQHGDINRLL